MHLFFQQAPRLREHFDRTFARVQDLCTPCAVRTGQDESDVLPANVGFVLDAVGKRPLPDVLIEHGRARARQARVASPSPAQLIRLGLLEAASRDPIPPSSLGDSDAQQLVRLSLFALGPAVDGVAEDVRELVVERLLNALERHVAADCEAFNRWFFDNVDNIVHQVAKQKRRGGPVPREVVRDVLLDLDFDSFQYVGDCVALQMQAVRQALPISLNPDEQRHFELMYLKQKCFGGFPLPLLRARFEFLEEAIVDLMTHGADDDRVGALLRMFDYYREMATARRDADRSYKRQ